MIRKFVLGVMFCILCLSGEIQGQKTTGLPAKVEGLELPEAVFVSPDDQFTTVQAKTSGQVKWLVISDKNVKYIEDYDNNKIILGTIPENSTVTVVAVANVHGKTTNFACTKVQIKKSNAVKKEIVEEKLDYKIRWH